MRTPGSKRPITALILAISLSTLALSLLVVLALRIQPPTTAKGA